MPRYTVSTTTDFALVAATAKTALRINAASAAPVVLRRLVITDKLAGASDEGLEYAIKTGGTDGTGTAVTPVPLNNAAACAAAAEVAYSVEPTGSPTTVMKNGVPAGGGVDLPFEGESGIRAGASSGIAIVLTGTQARASGIVEVTAEFEEL